MTWAEARLAISRFRTYYSSGDKEVPLKGTVKGRALQFTRAVEQQTPPDSVYPTSEGTIEFFWSLPGGVFHRVEVYAKGFAETMTTFPQPHHSAVFGEFTWPCFQPKESAAAIPTIAVGTAN